MEVVKHEGFHIYEAYHFGQPVIVDFGETLLADEKIVVLNKWVSELMSEWVIECEYVSAVGDWEKENIIEGGMWDKPWRIDRILTGEHMSTSQDNNMSK